jgi:hypothetical protein
MGMGAYHTSVRIGTDDSSPYTTTYTFVANQGIVQEKRRRTNTTGNNTSLPSHATFKEEIVLGSCTCQRGQVNEIIQILSQYYFTKTSYHLVHRNCNHFTETFATALIRYPDFIYQMNERNSSFTTTTTTPRKTPPKISLATYPDWINRLAYTGANVISHDSDIIPCHPYLEAYHAVTKTTMDQNTVDRTNDSSRQRWGGGFLSILQPGHSKSNTTTGGTSSSSSTKSKTTDTKKKELTEAQKKVLEKIRKK